MKLEEALKTTKFSSHKQKAVLNLVYTAWWLKTLITKELKIAGLTHEQFNVLRILRGRHPECMCVKDIGSRMIESNSNVPRIIDRLVFKKLVGRANSDIDKRETVIKLTVSGMHILDIANKEVDTIFKNSIPLTEEDAMQLNEFLENMRKKE